MTEILYCSRCRRPSETEVCPTCGQKLHLPILPEDLCYLTSQPSVWGGVLEEILEEEHIPFFRQQESGLSVITGSMTESWSYYVHYANLDRAAALVEELAGTEDLPEEELPEEELPEEEL